MYKVIKMGYVENNNYSSINTSHHEITAKGMCPFDGNNKISSRNKPYKADNDFLLSIFNDLLEDLFEQGLDIDGEKYTLSDESFENLKQDGSILPDDIYDAIYRDTEPKKLSNGILEYTNFSTGTIVHIDTQTDRIIEIFPNEDKSTNSLSKYAHCIYDNKPISTNINLVVKCTGYVIKGVGTACGFPSIHFEGFEIYIDDSLFDLERIDSDSGKTNKELLKEGKAPYGKDGKRINIHHINQNPAGPLKEMLQSKHLKSKSGLHPKRTNSQINRSKFQSFKKRYWKYRYKRLFGGE